MKTRNLVLSTVIFFLCSCDCSISIVGKVISSETGKPLSGAKIEMVGRKLVTTSNGEGDFTLEEFTGQCYTPKVRVTYDKYKTFEIEIEDEEDSRAYKLSRKFEYYDLDEPFYPDPNNPDTYVVSTSIEKYSTDFQIKSDTILIYLDPDNTDLKIQKLRNQIK